MAGAATKAKVELLHRAPRDDHVDPGLGRERSGDGQGQRQGGQGAPAHVACHGNAGRPVVHNDRLVIGDQGRRCPRHAILFGLMLDHSIGVGHGLPGRVRCFRPPVHPGDGPLLGELGQVAPDRHGRNPGELGQRVDREVPTTRHRVSDQFEAKCSLHLII